MNEQVFAFWGGERRGGAFVLWDILSLARLFFALKVGGDGIGVAPSQTGRHMHLGRIGVERGGLSKAAGIRKMGWGWDGNLNSLLSLSRLRVEIWA